MDSSACILNDKITQYCGSSCFWIHLKINNVRTKTFSCASIGSRVMTGDRSSRASHSTTDFLNCHWRKVTGIWSCWVSGSIKPIDCFWINSPFFSSATAHFFNSFITCFNSCFSGSKSRATSMGGFIDTQRTCFNDIYSNILIRDSQSFGDHKGHRCSAASNIWRAY